MNDLLTLMQSNRVKRFHTVDLLVPETTGHHVANVCTILCWMCYPRYPSINVFRAAVLHDAPELLTGDVPAPAKWANHKLEDQLRVSEERFWDDIEWMPYDYELSDKEKAVVKFADMADLCLKCIYEKQLGNRTIQEILFRGIDALDTRLPMIPEFYKSKAEKLILHIKENS